MASSRDRILETPLFALVGRGTIESNGVFNPMTDALDTTLLNDVLVSWWIDACSVKVRPAVQFSNDGVTWSDTAIAFGPAATNSEGWQLSTAYQDIFALGTERLFCRFGLWAFNVSANASSAVAKLRISARPVVGSSVRAGLRKVNSGDTDNEIFNPMTDWMPAADIAKLRATYEWACPSGNLVVRPGYQLANLLDTASDWSTNVAFGNSTSSEGVSFGTSFESVSFDKAFVRFGLRVGLNGGSTIRACRAPLRVDCRNT